MISNATEYQKAQDEIQSLEERLRRLQKTTLRVRKGSPRPELEK